MKTYKFTIICLIMLMGVALLSGCFNKDVAIQKGILAINVNIPNFVTPQFVDYVINVSEITITVTKGEYTFSKSVNPTTPEIGVTFNNLAIGVWEVTVKAKDADGIEIYSGTGSGLVNETDTTPVTIKLGLVFGDFEMKVQFPEGTEIASGNVTLYDPTNEAFVYTKELSLDSTFGTATFISMRPATWPVHTELCDSAGTLICDGDGYVDILPGRTTYADATVSTFDGLDITLGWDLPPVAPTGLSGYRNGTSGFVLSWDANTESNIAGYLIYRSESETGAKKLLTIYPTTDTSFTDLTAVYTHTYCYWVQAVNSMNLASNLSAMLVTEGETVPNYRIVYAIQTRDYANTLICSANLDGTNLVNLADEIGINNYPSASLEREKICYTFCDKSGIWKIMTMNFDGTNKNEIPLAISGSYYGTPLWSPDSTVIIVAMKVDNNKNLYIVNADGSNLQQLTTYTGDLSVSSYSWSPDGNYVLYKVWDSTNRKGIPYILDVITRESRQLVECINYSEGFWNSDGTKIYYRDYTDSTEESCTLYEINSDGTGKTAIYTSPVSPQTGIAFQASLSPDDRHVAIANNNKLVIINADGTQEKVIWENDRIIFNVEWTPDGSHLVLTCSFVDKQMELGRIKPDGTGLTRLTFEGETRTLPSSIIVF